MILVMKIAKRILIVLFLIVILLIGYGVWILLGSKTSNPNNYKTTGDIPAVYSPCNANDYNVNDASKIKSTNFEVVDKVEGKLYRKVSIGEVTRLIKRLVNQYL